MQQKQEPTQREQNKMRMLRSMKGISVNKTTRQQCGKQIIRKLMKTNKNMPGH